MSFTRYVSCFVLAGVWVLFSGSATIGNFLLGLIFGALILYALRDMFTFTDSPRDFCRTLPKKVVYAFVLIKEIIKANVYIAAKILQPKMNIRPGILAYPYETTRDMSTTILANTITLTPGTLVIDIHENKKSKEDGPGVLYVHAIDMDDPKDVRDSIRTSIEKYVREAFE